MVATKEGRFKDTESAINALARAGTGMMMALSPLAQQTPDQINGWLQTIIALGKLSPANRRRG